MRPSPFYMGHVGKIAVGLKLREEAIYQTEDFKIFGVQWQHMIIEKNLEALKHA